MPATPSTARAINDRLALSLFQREGPLTAAQLKQFTGLSRPSVADLVERLTAAGLIEVVGEAGEQRRGPNAKLYGIVAGLAHLAALDVRTEGVSVLVSDLVGGVLAEASGPIRDDAGTGPAVEQAVALVEQAAKEAGADRLHTVGIGAPGLIDPASGDLRDSGGLPAWHRRLMAAVQERFPESRVSVENETNLAALAEQRDGAARDRDTFVLLWLDLGIGAALVLDGALRRGASGGAGEVGFLPVPGTTGLPSATDCDGGFHSLASASAIVALAVEHGLTVPDGGRAAPADPTHASAPVRAATHLPALLRAATHAPALVRAAARGTDPAAGRFLDALADRVALGVAAVVSVLDPGCVVLAGEVGRAGGDALAGRVQRRLARMSPLRTEVRAGLLGGEAVLRGALLTARDRAQDELFAPPGS
ncbi:ROK family transcriptional regulator [Streptomyces sp. ISL-12]|uniref:ROK family transcriptional regulator n=1 Tax=Streptomyces sp. ISL-12 TaxID=2819177 RepID=UPI001BE57ECF|nr:ROK family transcriptional regulator [Streptomyces sp. ISL-12]MBT2412264.1 ROK family transcriptional regulator [Streptomyces sp. ISL-12]